ncbi:hypothetical protein NKH91_01545 [Mesorhizobium sp. M0894]
MIGKMVVVGRFRTDRRQCRMTEFALVDIATPDDRYVARHGEPGLLECVQGGHGGKIGFDEKRGRPVHAGGQRRDIGKRSLARLCTADHKVISQRKAACLQEAVIGGVTASVHRLGV